MKHLKPRLHCEEIPCYRNSKCNRSRTNFFYRVAKASMIDYDVIASRFLTGYLCLPQYWMCVVPCVISDYIYSGISKWRYIFSYRSQLNFRRLSHDWNITVSGFFLLLSLSLCIPSAKGYRRVSGLPPRVVNSDTERRTGVVGQTIFLSCAVTGSPPPERSWYKDGEQIGLDWKRFRQKRARLRIRNITLADSGLYTCQAVNGFGVSEKKIRLVIQDESSIKRRRKRPNMKPFFSQPVKMRRNVFVKPPGGAVNFRCRAKGKPRPEIRWYKDGNFTDLGVTNRAVRSPWTLTLKDIQVQDSGRYTCRVWNTAGQISFDYVLRVVGSNVHERPFLLPPHPVNTTVRKGNKGALLCNIRSTVSPTVKWIKKLDQASVDSFKGKWPNNSLKMDEKLYLILPPQQMIRKTDGSYLSKLIINKVKESDSGMYICLGANTMGYSFRYAYLTVLSDGRQPAVITDSRSTLSLGVVVGVSVFGLFLLFFVLIKCFWNHPGSNKRLQMSQQASVARSTYSEDPPLQTIEPQTAPVQSVERGDLVRIVHCGERGNYVNPTHTGSCCGSDVSRKSRQAPVQNNAGDVNESDLVSTCASLPPPPPPSQYSYSSTCVSSSSYSGRYKTCGHRCKSHHHRHHHHHHRHRGTSSSQYSNSYDDS